MNSRILYFLIILFCLNWLTESFGQIKFQEKLVDRLTVHFETNSYAIGDSDRIAIKQFIDQQDVVMPFMFRIQAHTDSIGSEEYNKKLSDKRSQAICNLVKSLGVPEILISTKGIGEMKPIMPNETEQGRAVNRRGNIFVFKIMKQRLFKSKVTLPGTKKVDAMVYVHNGESVDSVRTDKDGNFSFIVPEDSDLTYGVFAPGYLFETRRINSNKDLPIAQVELQKIEKNARIVLQNLYFVGDKPILLPESKPELGNLLRFLRMNKNLKVEIGGHVNGPASNHGDPKWYYDLAYNRTLSVRNYLVTNGLNGKNYLCKSYSNTQMVYPEPKTQDEAKLNRRVEIKILE